MALSDSYSANQYYKSINIGFSSSGRWQKWVLYSIINWNKVKETISLTSSGMYEKWSFILLDSN